MCAYGQLYCAKSGHLRLPLNICQIKDIENKVFNAQLYLESELLTVEETSTLLDMRGQCINCANMCFKTSFENDKVCQLFSTSCHATFYMNRRGNESPALVGLPAGQVHPHSDCNLFGISFVNQSPLALSPLVEN